MRYEEFYRRSIEQPESSGPSRRGRSTGTSRRSRSSTIPIRRSASGSSGGETNLCYNAVDRHLDERGDQLALVAISSETNVDPRDHLSRAASPK